MALTGVITFTVNNQFQVSSDAELLLNSFANYLVFNLANVPRDNAVLFTYV